MPSKNDYQPTVNQLLEEESLKGELALLGKGSQNGRVNSVQCTQSYWACSLTRSLAHLNHMVAPPLIVLGIHEVGELRDSEAILREEFVHEVVITCGVSGLQCAQQHLHTGRIKRENRETEKDKQRRNRERERGQRENRSERKREGHTQREG